MKQPKAPNALCDQCPLYSQPLVPGYGPDQADLVIVGEAPGSVEVQRGRPFLGRSGTLLDTELERLDLDRDEIYITNAVLCRPAGNRLVDYPDSVKCCRPRLIAEIKDRKPKRVLTMGSVPAQSLFEDKTLRITKVHGQHKRIDELDATIVMTLHPAFILRQGSQLIHLRRDLDGLFDDKEPVEETKYAVIEDPKVALATLTKLEKQLKGILVIDLETSEINPWVEGAFIICMQLTWEPGKSLVFGEDVMRDADFREAFGNLMNSDLEVWGHNLSFDVRWLEWFGYRGPRAWDDTMLLSYTMDETRGGHGLKALASEILGVDDWDAPLRQYLKKKSDSYATIPRNVLYKYAARDTDMTWQIRPHVLERVDETGMKLYNGVLKPVSRPLTEIEAYGMLIDRPKALAMYHEYIGVRTKLLAEMRDLAQRPTLNPNSPVQIAEVLYNYYGFPVLKTTPKGAASTGGDVLDALTVGDPDHPFLKLLVSYRQLNKIITTYLEAILSQSMNGGVAHPDFNLIGTVTGRLAAGLFLTIPRISKNQWAGPIRDLFIPRPGRVIWTRDYSQAELRVLCCDAKEPFWRDIWVEGRSLHGEMATVLYGEGWDHEDYMHAKMVTFGLTYGRGAPSIAEQFGWTVAQAEALIDDYLSVVPNVRRQMEKYRKTVKRQGYLETVFGRRRRFPTLTRENIHVVMNEALNFVPQSTASDLTLLSMVRMHQHPDLIPISNQLLMLHDGVIAEVDADKVDYFDGIAESIFSTVPLEYFSDYVPFESDSGVGESWGAAERDKEAK